MKLLKNTTLIAALVLLSSMAPAPAQADGDLSTFSLAGTVTGVWCLTGPEPPEQPCYVEIAVDVGRDDPAEIGVWCHGSMADVCEALPDGLRVIAIGKEMGSQKTVTHVGMWLEADA